MELNLKKPGAIGLSLHRVRDSIPAVEITAELHLFGARGDADKIDGLSHFPG